MHITTRPWPDSERGEHTTIDGEGHTTFIKREQFHVACFKATGVHDTSFENLHFFPLTGNPFKDCWRLLRWYFSKG